MRRLTIAVAVAALATLPACTVIDQLLPPVETGGETGDDPTPENYADENCDLYDTCPETNEGPEA